MRILVLDSLGGGGNFVPLEDDRDKNGHGSLMVDVILSVNPKADVTAVKVVDGSGYTTSSLLCSGLIYAWENSFDIISISLAPNYLSPEVIYWLDTLANDGVIICAASGNGFPSALARHSSVVGVGALDEDGNVASYTKNWDVLAPGYYKGRTGTSISCAYYVGLLSKGGD